MMLNLYRWINTSLLRKIELKVSNLSEYPDLSNDSAEINKLFFFLAVCDILILDKQTPGLWVI